MKLGIRAKLFLISLGLIALSVLVAYVYARAQIERDATLRVRSDLVVRAQLVAARAGEELADEAVLGPEQVEQHPRAAPDGLGQGAERQSGQAVIEDVLVARLQELLAPHRHSR